MLRGEASTEAIYKQAGVEKTAGTEVAASLARTLSFVAPNERRLAAEHSVT